MEDDVIDAQFGAIPPARYRMQVSLGLLRFLFVVGIAGIAMGAYYAGPWGRVAAVLAAVTLWPVLRSTRALGEQVSEKAAERLRSSILHGPRR